MSSFFQSKSRKIKFKPVKNISKSVDAVTSHDFWKLKFIKNPRTLVFATYLASFALVGLVIGIFVVIGVFAYFSRELPDPNRLLERSFELSTRFYDKNDKLLYEVFGDKNRTLVNIQDVSPDLVHATLATEDSDFYFHNGFSLRGMTRALRNMVFGGDVQGGSTLTQQVIKNSILSSEQTLPRKIKEFILALQLENKYSKDQIIQMYLNESPYGGQNYGVLSAAKIYFNKSPKDVTLAEAAYLSGLTQRPSYYSNFGTNPQAGIERKNYVLYLMHERGWFGPDGKRYFINDEDYEKAKAEEIKFQQFDRPFVAPHFVLYTKQVLVDMFGEDIVERGGLQVKTSLDLDVQTMAEKIVEEEVTKANSLNVHNGAMVVLDPKTSQIWAMVGSKGYNLKSEPEGCTSGGTDEKSCKFDPYVNVATSLRQPGSAIKPVTYATMLAQGYTVAFPFLDVPTRFQGSSPDKPYIPVNYDGKFRGVVSLRRSLANSLNIPAVKALKIGGIDNMIDTAEKMGITTFTDRQRYGLALTLGGGETKLLELTGAYNVFAAKGTFRKPSPIIEIKDSQDNVIFKAQESNGAQALTPEVSFLISDILSDDGARSDAFGAGSLLNIKGQQVAVKTGTTDDKRDNYALGFTPSVTVGVWVGNSNNEKMNPYVASGVSGATPIWNRFFTEFLKDKTAEKFEAPSKVKKIAVDRLTGMLPESDSETRNEWFIEGTEPTAKSNWYRRLEICKIDGRIANSGCKDANETEVKTFIKVQAELPEWQYGADAWVKENYTQDDKYFPPQMTSALDFDGSEVSNKNQVTVSIQDLKDGDKVFLDFRLNVEVSAYEEIDHVNFYMDGDQKGDDSSLPYGFNFNLGGGDIGKHEFEVTVTDENGNKGSKKIELNVTGYSQ